MRSPQPALRDRRMRVDGAHESNLAQVGGEYAEHEEQVGVLGARGHLELRCERAGYFGFFFERLGEEGDSVAHRVEGGRFLVSRRGRQLVVDQIHLGPLGAGDWPFVFMPLDELVDMTDLQLDLRLALPVAFAFQEMIEKAQLQLAAVVRVEMGPMLDAVRLEPLVFAVTPDEALEISARMQPLPAPVRGREQRLRDLVPLR